MGQEWSQLIQAMLASNQSLPDTIVGIATAADWMDWVMTYPQAACPRTLTLQWWASQDLGRNYWFEL
jgi:hypothetical protein